MRLSRSFFTAVAFAAAACAPLAHAAEAQPANAQQMSEIAGDYQLSDGRRIQIDFDGVDVYIQVDKRARQQLLGTSDGQFRTFDGAIQVRRNPAADAPAVDIMLRGQPVRTMR